MPTFTTIALETLLEPRVRDSYSKKPFDFKQRLADNTVPHLDKKKQGENDKPPAPIHIYIKPALYATPKQQPIPDSSSESLSPSPYVVNHKRRGGDSISRRVDGFQISEQQNSPDDGSTSTLNLSSEDGVENADQSLVENSVDDNFLAEEIICERQEVSLVQEDDFTDPRCDSFSVASCDTDFGRQLDNQSLTYYQGEFFDAYEEFSSDGSISSIPSYGQSIEAELCATKVSLLKEIERRKHTEDAVGMMNNQWQRISYGLSQAGLTFPMPSDAGGSMQLDSSSIEQFSQEIIVSRFVAEAIGKGLARAEAEQAAEAIIESKNHEISRLRDKLQYYEAVNHEMSQRNQEVIEVARRQRQRRNSQRKWLWGSIGVAVAMGASAIAYLYRPQTSGNPPASTSHSSSDA